MSRKVTPETAMKKAIKDYLKYTGWFTFYNLNYGIGVYKGISDLTAIKKGRVLFIEVKSKKGVQSKHQIDFERDVKESGSHYILARSVDDIDKYIVDNFGEKSLLL